MSEKTPISLAHHHTAVCVSHWETSVAFYEKLGFTVINDWFWPDGVKNHKSLLQFGGRPDCWLELFEYPEGRGKLNEDYTQAPGCVYHFALETLEESGVDLMYAHAISAGGSPAEPPRDFRFKGEKGVWSFRRATVAGPDGELISFVYDRGIK